MVGWFEVVTTAFALKGPLPAVDLDGLTAGLFVVFAAWILYGSPAEESAGARGVRPGRRREPQGAGDASGGPGPAGRTTRRGFVPALSMMVSGEFDDETQLITIGLAVQYGAHPGTWLGEMLPIVPVSLLTALAFRRTAHRFDVRWCHRVSASTSLLFAVDVVGTSFLHR